MLLFSTVPYWAQHVEGSFDPRAIVVANLMKTKTNVAQIIVGSLEGRVSVLKAEKNEGGSLTNEVVSAETQAPILGLEVGAFSGPSLLCDHNEGKTESLELAVIHPRDVCILAPKRLQDGVIALESIGTINFYKQIVSYCVITTSDNTTEVGTKLYHTKLAIRTEDGTLYICTRTILAAHNLGLLYSLPTPMVFCPLANLLVIAAFDYSISAFLYTDLISDSHGDKGVEGLDQGLAAAPVQDFNSEGNPLIRSTEPTRYIDRPSQLRPQWVHIIGERVQRLTCARLFGVDSSAEGEVIALHPHGVTLVSASSGVLAMELQLSETRAIDVALFQTLPNASDASTQTSRRRRTVLPETSSVLFLDSSNMVHLFYRGELKWVSRLHSAMTVPTSISTSSCLAQMFTIAQPPKICGQDGLFVTLSRDGSVRAHMFGTRPLYVDGQALDTVPSLFAPITISKQAVAKVTMEDAQRQLNALKVECKEALTQGLANTLTCSCEIKGFSFDTGVYYSLILITVKATAKGLTQVILGIIGCGDQENPITEPLLLTEHPPLSPGPVAPLIQLGDGKHFNAVTTMRVSLDNTGVSAVYVRFGISSASFFASPYIKVCLSAEMPSVSSGSVVKTPIIITRNLQLPLFSAASIHSTVKSKSQQTESYQHWPYISFSILSKESGEPFTTLHELLVKRPFSPTILSEIAKESPNSISIYSGVTEKIRISMDNQVVRVASIDLEYLQTGIEFFLGYKAHFQLKSIDYDEQALLEKLTAIYTQMLDVDEATARINTHLGVISELVSDVLQLVADALPRIPQDMRPFELDFTNFFNKYSTEHESVVGDLHFLMESTFTHDRSVLSSAYAHNTGDKIDALLAYYELQLQEAQQLSLNKQRVLQKLKAGMTIIITIIGVHLLMAEGSTKEFFEQLRQCLTDFEDISHLCYFVTHFSAGSSSHAKVFNPNSRFTPDQFSSALHTLLSTAIS